MVAWRCCNETLPEPEICLGGWICRSTVSLEIKLPFVACNSSVYYRIAIIFHYRPIFALVELYSIPMKSPQKILRLDHLFRIRNKAVAKHKTRDAASLKITGPKSFSSCKEKNHFNVEHHVCVFWVPLLCSHTITPQTAIQQQMLKKKYWSFFKVG